MGKSGYILAATAVLALSACLTGCGADTFYMDPERQAEGLIIILPGIEGESSYNHEIRDGLLSAGISKAITIYKWGRPVPVLGFIMNQVDFIGNYIFAGAGVARMIEEYQDKHPGKPVFLIGHSGGGGIAVFAAQQLSEKKQIDGVILLSASISAGYDLSKALKHCKLGIVNFYNTSDIGLLGVGTTIMGNVDGGHGPSAGRTGFNPPSLNVDTELLNLYGKLYQVEMTYDMTMGESDLHGAATRSYFVEGYVADWITAAQWPPTGITYVGK